MRRRPCSPTQLGSASGRASRNVAAHASLVQLLVRLRTGDAENWRDEAAETIAEAMAVFEQSGDDAGLAKAWRLLAWTHGTACHFGHAAEASDVRSIAARAAGDVRQQTRAATAYAAAALYGPTPVDEAIARCELTVPSVVSGDRQAEGMLLALLASLVAMHGSFERARELAAHGRALLEELDLGVEVASARLEAWRVEMFAGDAEAAERQLRPRVRLSRGGRREVLPLDGRGPARPDSLCAGALRRGRVGSAAWPRNWRPRGRRRSGAVALYPGQAPRTRGLFEEAERSSARRSTSSSRPTQSSSSSARCSTSRRFSAWRAATGSPRGSRPRESSPRPRAVR